MIKINTNNLDTYGKNFSKAVSVYCKRGRVTTYSKSRIDPLIIKFFGDIVTNLEGLICAKPSVLEKIYLKYTGFTPRKKLKVQQELNLIGLYDYFNDKQVRFEWKKETFQSENVFDKLNIKNCPYCNENPNYYFQNSKFIRRTFEWDHFYPKEKFPFFAISFYNIIPSCKVCNHLKHENFNNYLNPYEDYKTNETIKFYLDIKNSDFISNQDSFEILPKYSKDVNGNKLQNNFEDLYIMGRFNRRKDVILTSLKKKRLYNHEYTDRLFDEFNGKLFLDKTEFRELFFDANFSEVDFHKKQFSKLIHDIFNDKRY
jgi:hypothetical protein